LIAVERSVVAKREKDIIKLLKNHNKKTWMRELACGKK